MPKVSFLEKIWHGYSEDVGKSLIHLGALGWLFSAAAQIGMISYNKDIDKKEKKFLIPQEISDGIINVVLYYTICQSIKSFTDNSIEKGKVLTSNVIDFFNKIGVNSVNKNNDKLKNIVDAFKDVGLIKSQNKKNITNVLDGLVNFWENKNPEATFALENKYPSLSNNIKNAFAELSKENTINSIKNTQKRFCAFKNGVGVLAAVGASILACNIITPVCRNISANYFQKRLLNHKCTEKVIQHNKRITYSSELSPTFNCFRI